MKILLSPSKTMELKDIEGIQPSIPQFYPMTRSLVEQLKESSKEDLAIAMQLSGTLAEEVYEAYQNFSFDNVGSPAISSFTGLVYKRIGVEDFTREELEFTQEKFVILSALYGIIRPFDGVNKYRLEMKSDWMVGGKKLYKYWNDRIYNSIFADNKTVVSLASNEYAKQLAPYIKEDDPYIVVSFLSGKGGKYQNKPTDAKIARGKMARYIVKNRLTKPEELKMFDIDGYKFSEKLSDNRNYVFVKK